MSTFSSLLARLKEPRIARWGIRTLVTVVFLLKGQVFDDAQVDQVTDLVFLALAFLTPTTTTQLAPAPVATPVEAPVATVVVAAEKIQETAQATQSFLTRLKGLVR